MTEATKRKRFWKKYETWRNSAQKEATEGKKSKGNNNPGNNRVCNKEEINYEDTSNEDVLVIDVDPIDISDNEEKNFADTKLEYPVFKPMPVYMAGSHSPPQIASPACLFTPYPPAVNLIQTFIKLPLPVRPAAATLTTASPTRNSYTSSPPLASSSPLNATCLTANTLTHAPVSLSRLSVSPGDIKNDFAYAYSHKKFGKNKFVVMSCDDTSSLSPVSPTALPPGPTISPQSAWVAEQVRLPSSHQPVDLTPGQQHEQPHHEIPSSSIPYSTHTGSTVRPVRSISVIMVPVSK